MSKKDLQAEELIKLSEEEEIFNLESLITEEQMQEYQLK